MKKKKQKITVNWRMNIGLASDLSITWIFLTCSSPSGLGLVISSAISLAASSNFKKNLFVCYIF